MDNLQFTDFTIASLREHYDKIYDKPESDHQAIATLIGAYAKEMNDKNVSQATKAGIGEIYRELLGKGLPSYYWMLEAIHRTAKKRSDKRHFGYVVGTLRNWALYGFGNTLSDDEEEIFEYFTELTGLALSVDARKIINSLLGRYGAIKLLKNMPSMTDGIDISAIIAEHFAKKMIERYGAVEELLPEPKQALVIEERVDQTKSKQQENKDRQITDRLQSLIFHIEEYLKDKDSAKSKDIAEHLNRIGFDNITTKNMTSNLIRAMAHSDHIKKIGFGIYTYK